MYLLQLPLFHEHLQHIILNTSSLLSPRPIPTPFLQRILQYCKFFPHLRSISLESGILQPDTLLPVIANSCPQLESLSFNVSKSSALLNAITSPIAYSGIVPYRDYSNDNATDTKKNNGNTEETDEDSDLEDDTNQTSNSTATTTTNNNNNNNSNNSTADSISIGWEFLLATCTKLTSLTLRGSFDLFATALKTCGENLNQLQHLDLSDNSINPQLLNYVAHYCPELNSLLMKNTRMPSLWIPIIAYRFAKLSKLHLPTCNAAFFPLGNFGQLTELRYHDTEISTNTLQSIAKNCSSLKKLALVGKTKGIQDESLKELSSSLKELEELNLSFEGSTIDNWIIYFYPVIRKIRYPIYLYQSVNQSIYLSH